MAREVVKHPSVESVVQCEIDERVIEVSKQYMPFMAKGFDHPKLTLHIGDGFEFIKNHPKEFDIIITDSSDPIGNCYLNGNPREFCCLSSSICLIPQVQRLHSKHFHTL